MSGIGVLNEKAVMTTLTNKEAIEILNALAWVQGGPDREEVITAISMVIDALKSKPKSKKWIKKISGDCWNDWYVYICPYCGQVHEKITYSYTYCPNCGAYLKEDTNK